MAGISPASAEYNGGSLELTAIILLAVTWVSVILRTYVRAIMTKSFQADDWLMLAAQANFTVSCVFILIGVFGYGLGHHNADLAQWMEIEAIKWQALATATYITNMMFVKLSIGVFLLRLAVQKRYKWTIYISMTVVLIWSVALFFWDVFQCSPVAAQWDYTIPNYTCVAAQQVINAAYALSVLNIITDWLYALMPIPMIWKVKMTSQAKATVVAILGLGIFASVATLIRVKFLADLTDTSDILYAGTDAMVWTLVEPGVAIVASSLVTIRPLLRQLRFKGFESTERSRSRGFWGRSGRSTGLSGLSGNTAGLNSKKNWSQLPGNGPGDVKLKDLEGGGGHGGGGFRAADGGSRKKNSNNIASKNGGSRGGGVTSTETTLNSSRTSTHGGKNWGAGVAIIEREEEKDDISPISGVTLSPTTDSSESVFVIEGPARIRQAQIKGATTMWRSETPNSPEQSEHIQGLRYPIIQRGNVSRGSSQSSLPGLPIQSNQ